MSQSEPAASALTSDAPAERIAVAADHAGVELKRSLVEHLRQRGFVVEDLGPQSTASVDYADFAHEVAARVAAGDCSSGLLICGTGVGMAMAANRHRGVRAVNCTDLLTVRMSRGHNDANVLALGARVIGAGLATELVDTFFDAPFEEGRHRGRVAKIELP